MATQSRFPRDPQNSDAQDFQEQIATQGSAVATADSRPSKRASRRSLIRLGGAAAAAAAVAAVAGHNGIAHAAPRIADTPDGPWTGATGDSFAIISGQDNLTDS